MKRLIYATIVLSMAGVAAPAISADEPGRSGDPASAEKLPPGKVSPHQEGATSQEPGRSGDPASAEKVPAGSTSPHQEGAPSQEPGRSGDPASAEKRH